MCGPHDFKGTPEGGLVDRLCYPIDEEVVLAKFLVLWHLDQALLSAEMARAVQRMPAYGEGLESKNKCSARYHLVGGHGGCWIYDVDSNEELEMLLAQAPVFNFAHYDVRPLADMSAMPLSDPQP